MTFEYLFPRLHAAIKTKINQFYGNNFKKNAREIMARFNIKSPNIQNIYGRTKSTNSIWRKIPNIKALEKMELPEFIKVVNDLIALRWNIKPKANENRYDALINGIRLVPKENIQRFRNQQITQQSGFSCEPVLKFYYIINKAPVELQLLGGKLEFYMSAKGYADYKARCFFPPARESLTDLEHNARLGTCIFLAEQGFALDYHSMMLEELARKGKISYQTEKTFVLDDKPNNPENLSIRFAEIEKPIYLLNNCEFGSQAMVLSN